MKDEVCKMVRKRGQAGELIDQYIDECLYGTVIKIETTVIDGRIGGVHEGPKAGGECLWNVIDRPNILVPEKLNLIVPNEFTHKPVRVHYTTENDKQERI